MTPLCELARKYGTDKGGEHHIAGEICHFYTEVYWTILAERREQVRRVLEIGVNSGASLRMWEEFFPNAEIIGLDIVPTTLFNSGRIRCLLADQGSSGSLRYAAALAGGTFDLIVDDGSHEPFHQLLSMVVLLPFLSPSGQYVVEDMVGNTPNNLLASIPPGYQGDLLPCRPCLGPERYRSDLLVVKHV